MKEDIRQFSLLRRQERGTFVDTTETIVDMQPLKGEPCTQTPEGGDDSNEGDDALFEMRPFGWLVAGRGPPSDWTVTGQPVELVRFDPRSGLK